MSAILYHKIEDTIMNNLYEEFMMIKVTEGGVYNCRSRITEIFLAKKEYFSIKLISFYFFLDYTLWCIFKTKKYQNVLCTDLIITEEKLSEIKSLRLWSKLPHLRAKRILKGFGWMFFYFGRRAFVRFSATKALMIS